MKNEKTMNEDTAVEDTAVDTGSDLPSVKFGMVIADRETAIAADKLAKSILRKDAAIDEMVTALVTVDGVIIDKTGATVFGNVQTIKDCLVCILSIAGVQRKTLEDRSQKNSFDYRVSSVVSKVAVELELEEEEDEKVFSLDKKFDNFVKAIEKAESEGKATKTEVLAHLVKAAEKLTGHKIDIQDDTATDNG